MGSLDAEKQDVRVQKMQVSDDTLTVDLEDGRSISVPLLWYPRLWYGTSEERNRYEIFGNGTYIHWPDLDEDLTAEGIIAGYRSGESPDSLKKWLECRKGKGKWDIGKGWIRRFVTILWFCPFTMSIVHFPFQTFAQQLTDSEIPDPVAVRNLSPRFENLSLGDGLSQSSINDMFQDRTGFISALVLLALGVPEATVYEDYLATNRYRAAFTDTVLRWTPLYSLFRTQPEDLLPLLDARREYLEASLQQIRDDWGSVDIYLEAALGLTPARREALRTTLLTAHSSI